jgi:hypothetical protein
MPGLILKDLAQCFPDLIFIHPWRFLKKEVPLYHMGLLLN